MGPQAAGDAQSLSGGVGPSETPPVVVRFTASDGVHWTVWDVTRWAYKFKPSDTRVLEERPLAVF